MIFRTLAMVAGAAVATTSATPARADGWSATFLPGAARSIPRTSSASRDTPLLELSGGTETMASLGLEAGIVAITRSASANEAGKGADAEPLADHAFHVGLFGMVALQNQDSKGFFPNEYWRGLAGISFTYSPTWIGRRLFGRGGDVELGFLLGHESDHRSDAAPPFSSIVQSEVFQNYVGADVGVRIPIGGALTLVARVGDHLNAGGLFSQDPSAGLELRLVTWRVPQPFIVSFGEVLVATGKDASCPSGRLLAGIAFVGRFGELSPFGGLEGGCDKGLLYTRRGLRGEGGLRYTPFR